MKTLACSCAALAVALAAVVPVLAQPAIDPSQGGVIASAPHPDTAQESPGIPSDQAVNPAPGATGPYVGAGPKGFYDVDQRISQVAQRVASLPPAQRRRAAAMLRSIRSEEATQRARHGGELRDWDREKLTDMLDKLAAQVPGLGG